MNSLRRTTSWKWDSFQGYAKTDGEAGEIDRFHQNRRLLYVVWDFANGASVGQEFTDSPTMQVTPLMATSDWVRVTIMEVSPHGGREFVAISDVRIVGVPAPSAAGLAPMPDLTSPDVAPPPAAGTPGAGGGSAGGGDIDFNDLYYPANPVNDGPNSDGTAWCTHEGASLGSPLGTKIDLSGATVTASSVDSPGSRI